MIRKSTSKDIEKLKQFYNYFSISYDENSELPFGNIYVYEYLNEVVGFIDYSIIYDRAELNYIYIDESNRKSGIASMLMDYFITESKKNNCKNITLEVSSNNILARRLYLKYGFVEVATRKNYYKDSDGILMMKELI